MVVLEFGRGYTKSLHSFLLSMCPSHRLSRAALHAASATLLFLVGFGSAFAQSRIVGGTKAPDDSYPWMSAVADRSGGSLFNRQFCGGSLIAPDWVLTAAHCIEGRSASGLQVVVGVNNLDNSSGAEIRTVRGIYRHPRFRDIRGDLFNDVALLLLDSPVESIDPTEFATSPNSVPIGTAVRALGWGDTRTTPRYPRELRMVDLNLVSIGLARRTYGTPRLNHRHLAAKGAGKDTCGGDSGGPLFVEGGGTAGAPLLIGITSYGLGCARSGVPGIYANVGNYASWIYAFLSQDVEQPPVAVVRGMKRPIANGTKGTTVRNGTNFGRRVRAGRSVVRRFEVRNVAGKTPLSITSARSTSKDFRVVNYPPYVFGGQAAPFRVRFRAPKNSRTGVARSRITLSTNDPAKPSFSFAVASRYRGS